MKTLWIALAVMAVSGCCCKSKGERLKAAEEHGEQLAGEKARLIKGIGNALDKEGTVAGEQVAKGAARVVKSVGGGAMEGFNELGITTSAELGTAGLKAERAGIAAVDGKKDQVKVYVIFDKPYKGDLTLKLLDKAGKEAGRSKIAVDEQSTGKYVLFPFDPLTEWMQVAAAELK